MDASVSFSFSSSLPFICYFTNNNYKGVCLKNCKPWAINNENMQICDWQNYGITAKIQYALQLKRKYLNTSNFCKIYFLSTRFQSPSKKWVMNRLNHARQSVSIVQIKKYEFLHIDRFITMQNIFLYQNFNSHFLFSGLNLYHILKQRNRMKQINVGLVHKAIFIMLNELKIWQIYKSLLNVN